jgi:outer membrane lipoprotein SlyB
VSLAVDGADFFRERGIMKTVFAILAVAALTFASASSADAKGCIKGAVVGGVAGHVAGHHGALGAAAGCIVGHHRANEQDKQQPQQTQGQPRDAQGKM